MDSSLPYRLTLLAALFLAFALVGCGQAPPPRSDKAVEVVVTTPITDDVLDHEDFTGRIDAFRTVDVRSRVTGYVEEAPFKEGDLVKKGDLLFQIDPRSYKADLAQAEANLSQAAAERGLQQANASRARQLISSRAINREEYDQILASQEKATANTGSLQAARDRAALFVEYTRVTSPITGRISRRNVDPGNLVKADDTLLTTVVSDEIVYAYFDLDERTYLDLVGEKPSAGSSARAAELKFPVLLCLANSDEYNHAGYVDFIDNRINGNSGTIRMRAVIKNPRGTLKAGLFVRIRLPIGNTYKALLIPDEALQSDQGRKVVYVVNAENKVEYRSVKFGQAIQGLRVIKEGLKPEERVIVSGMQRVRPGLQVQATMQDPPKAPTSPLEKLLKGSHPEAEVPVGTNGAGSPLTSILGRNPRQ